MEKTAVIILNWNGAQMLRTYLPSVIAHTKGAEIIVTDNGSTDDSLEVLHKEFPSVKTIVLDTNYGFAEGYNKALEQVESEYVVLLNSDVEVTEGNSLRRTSKLSSVLPLSATMISAPFVCAMTEGR